jgi:hypothetical protein
MSFRRDVKCQICPHREARFSPILAKPCPKCGARMTYAFPQYGDPPVTPTPTPNPKSPVQNELFGH